MVAEDAKPLIEALLSIIDAARAYLPPDGIGKDEFIARVLETTDNPRIIAAHGHPVAGWGSRAVPTINLTDDELAAVTAAIRQTIETDRFPHAPRLDPLRAALGKFEAASEPTPPPKAPPAAKADKRARRSPAL